MQNSTEGRGVVTKPVLVYVHGDGVSVLEEDVARQGGGGVEGKAEAANLRGLNTRNLDKRVDEMVKHR